MAGWTALGPHPVSGASVFFVLCLFIVYWLHAAEIRLAPDAREVLSQDDRAPVLYLRPFTNDTNFVTVQVDPFLDPSGEKTVQVEDCLLSLNSLGPLVCIAEPAPISGMQAIGAYRDEPDTRGWQARVLELLDQACLVVMAIGDSPGIGWEIDQVRKRTPPESLLLFLPPQQNPTTKKRDREREARARYEQFQKLFNQHFSIELPPFSQATYFIGFDAGGNPVLPHDSSKNEQWIDDSKDIESAINIQLKAVMRRIQPEINFGSYKIQGRLARKVRIGFAIVLFLVNVPLSMIFLSLLVLDLI